MKKVSSFFIAENTASQRNEKRQFDKRVFASLEIAFPIFLIISQKKNNWKSSENFDIEKHPVANARKSKLNFATHHSLETIVVL